jgi:hypothetical protein
MRILPHPPLSSPTSEHCTTAVRYLRRGASQRLPQGACSSSTTVW